MNNRKRYAKMTMCGSNNVEPIDNEHKKYVYDSRGRKYARECFGANDFALFMTAVLNNEGGKYGV